jgi:hypothetical protein
LVIVCFISPAFGLIVGDTFSVEWRFPDLGSTIFSDSVVVPGSTGDCW